MSAAASGKPSRAERELIEAGVPYSHITYEAVRYGHARANMPAPPSSLGRTTRMADHPINWDWIRAEIGGDRIDRLNGEDAPAPADRHIPPTQRD